MTTKPEVETHAKIFPLTRVTDSKRKIKEEIQIENKNGKESRKE